MAKLGLQDLDALFVTHEHADHMGHARAFAIQTGKPIWMSQGTAIAGQAVGWGLADTQIKYASDASNFAVGCLELTPFTVPHDAREPLQLRCSDGAHHLGILTDLGHASPHVIQSLQGCHALLLECNHDPDLLARSTYPSFLKQRIAGPQGHLSNQEAAQISKTLQHDHLNLLVAAHLSERNNAPALAQNCLAEALNCLFSDIPVADPQNGTAWHTVH
jgi:phosphoribosyl 1,2-cyclic phosphodiesterase